jgi:hypothetical protein
MFFRWWQIFCWKISLNLRDILMFLANFMTYKEMKTSNTNTANNLIFIFKKDR